MTKILMIEGLCSWDGFVHKSLAAEGFQIMRVPAPLLDWQQLDDFQPDVILVGLGAEYDHGWHIFRRLKSYDPALPVLIYQVVNGRGVEDLKKAIAEALVEAERKKCQDIHYRRTPQMAM